MAIEREPLGAARTEVTESRAVRRPLRAVLLEEGVGLGERGRVRHTVGATHGGTVCRGEDLGAAVWYVLYASDRLPHRRPRHLSSRERWLVSAPAAWHRIRLSRIRRRYRIERGGRTRALLRAAMHCLQGSRGRGCAARSGRCTGSLALARDWLDELAASAASDDARTRAVAGRS